MLNKVCLSQYPPDSDGRVQSFVDQMGKWITQASLCLPFRIRQLKRKDAYSWQDAQAFGIDSEGPASEAAEFESGRVPLKVLKRRLALQTAKEKPGHFQERVERLEQRLRSLQIRSFRLASINATLSLSAPQTPFLDIPFPKAGFNRAKGISFDSRFKVRISLALVSCSNHVGHCILTGKPFQTGKTLLAKLENDGEEQDCLIRHLQGNIERAWRAEGDRREAERPQKKKRVEKRGRELWAFPSQHWEEAMTNEIAQQVEETQRYFDERQAALCSLVYIALRRSQG